MYRGILCLLTGIAAALLSACKSYTADVVLKPADPPPASASLAAETEILFLILGDTGRGNITQAETGNRMAEVCETRRPGRGCDFALVAGDLIYMFGVKSTSDRKFDTHFETPFAVLGDLPMWSVPGNHDWYKRGSVQAQIDYTARSPRWRMPFNHFGVSGLPAWLAIYGLDTSMIHDRKGKNAAKDAALTPLIDTQIASAKSTLCGKAGWRLLFGHHPIYSSGPHGMENGNQGTAKEIHASLAPLIQECGVQIYFAGHDHIQEHIRSPKEGFDQITEGAAAAATKVAGAIANEDVSSLFVRAEPGFGLVTATPQALKVEFFCVNPDQPGQALTQPCYQFTLPADAAQKRYAAK